MAKKRRYLVLLVQLLIISALLGLGSCQSLQDQTSWRWTVSGPVTPVNWISSKAGNLPVLPINCTDVSGGNQHSLLGGLAGFKDSGSADRFIASLNVDCIPYVEFGGRYVQYTSVGGGIRTTTLTTHLSFKTTSGEIPLQLEGREVPIGVIVYHNNKNYVQNLHLVWGLEENGIITDYINWYDYDPSEARFTFPTISDWPNIRTLRLAGTPFPVSRSRQLICPSQNTVKGMRIQQSSNGKIRSLGIDCQLLTNN